MVLLSQQLYKLQQNLLKLLDDGRPWSSCNRTACTCMVTGTSKTSANGQKASTLIKMMLTVHHDRLHKFAKTEEEKRGKTPPSGNSIKRSLRCAKLNSYQGGCSFGGKKAERGGRRGVVGGGGGGGGGWQEQGKQWP